MDFPPRYAKIKINCFCNENWTEIESGCYSLDVNECILASDSFVFCPSRNGLVLALDIEKN